MTLFNFYSDNYYIFFLFLFLFFFFFVLFFVSLFSSSPLLLFTMIGLFLFFYLFFFFILILCFLFLILFFFPQLLLHFMPVPPFFCLLLLLVFFFFFKNLLVSSPSLLLLFQKYPCIILFCLHYLQAWILTTYSFIFLAFSTVVQDDHFSLCIGSQQKSTFSQPLRFIHFNVYQKDKNKKSKNRWKKRKKKDIPEKKNSSDFRNKSKLLAGKGRNATFGIFSACADNTRHFGDAFLYFIPLPFTIFCL